MNEDLLSQYIKKYDDVAKANRVVDDELYLLKNGLIALNKGKVHITKDHIERVIYNLEKLLKEIRS